MHSFDPGAAITTAMPVVKEVIPLAVAVLGAVTGGALFAANKTREAPGEKGGAAFHNDDVRRVVFSPREVQDAGRDPTGHCAA